MEGGMQTYQVFEIARLEICALLVKSRATTNINCVMQRTSSNINHIKNHQLKRIK